MRFLKLTISGSSVACLFVYLKLIRIDGFYTSCSELCRASGMRLDVGVQKRANAAFSLEKLNAFADPPEEHLNEFEALG